jgi:hypothetical protein
MKRIEKWKIYILKFMDIFIVSRCIFSILALSQLGALAVAVPGEVAGYWEAKQRSSFL